MMNKPKHGATHRCGVNSQYYYHECWCPIGHDHEVEDHAREDYQREDYIYQQVPTIQNKSD